MVGQVPDHLYITYCIYKNGEILLCNTEKKQTECVQPSGYKTAKNGRLMFWCTCT